MGHAIVTKHEPGHQDFDALATAKHLNTMIESFSKPNGLMAYWGTAKVQARLMHMKQSWRMELQKRYENQLDILNNAGPY